MKKILLVLSLLLSCSGCLFSANNQISTPVAKKEPLTQLTGTEKNREAVVTHDYLFRLVKAIDNGFNTDPQIRSKNENQKVTFNSSSLEEFFGEDAGVRKSALDELLNLTKKLQELNNQNLDLKKALESGFKENDEIRKIVLNRASEIIELKKQIVLLEEKNEQRIIKNEKNCTAFEKEKYSLLEKTRKAEESLTQSELKYQKALSNNERLQKDATFYKDLYEAQYARSTKLTEEMNLLKENNSKANPQKLLAPGFYLGIGLASGSIPTFAYIGLKVWAWWQEKK